MGGAKTKRKAPPKKKKATVPKSFNCPFCNHESSCEVKLDRVAETGAIACRVCGESYKCRVTYLSDPVDVFCDWVDELERARSSGGVGGSAAADDGPVAAPASSSSSSSSAAVNPKVSAARLDGSAASDDDDAPVREPAKKKKKTKKSKPKRSSDSESGGDSD